MTRSKVQSSAGSKKGVDSLRWGRDGFEQMVASDLSKKRGGKRRVQQLNSTTMPGLPIPVLRSVVSSNLAGRVSLAGGPVIGTAKKAKKAKIQQQQQQQLTQKKQKTAQQQSKQFLANLPSDLRGRIQIGGAAGSTPNVVAKTSGGPAKTAGGATRKTPAPKVTTSLPSVVSPLKAGLSGNISAPARATDEGTLLLIRNLVPQCNIQELLSGIESLGVEYNDQRTAVRVRFALRNQALQFIKDYDGLNVDGNRLEVSLVTNN
ncbi:hypothetical protein H696_01149 [Fonticula alba]|uniref:Uncharacterized protein n=1 Tax=Fonticula alba TaxID=691883 RepID=A0A058ZCR9_FONAL|nr:hypothetical protein H696_01149 [Fonticula alba]KCV71728.1 hypothetical protein H696_01149 [Fonticula alba]|eukprot:XP_009493306.1 hypothetical protein H696_01149 [Fonticula alba]